MSRAPAAIVAAILASLALAACGGSGQSSVTVSTPSSTTTATTPPAPPPKETRDALPDRPQDWVRFVNERGGYAMFLPRGWETETDGPRSLIRSFDRLVAISISPDRSAATAATPVGDYARNTVDSLRGFRRGLQVEGTRPFDSHYDAVQVRGSGISNHGVAQQASLIVMRRGRVATIAVVLAANAKPVARESLRLARRAIRTLRTRPPVEDSN